MQFLSAQKTYALIGLMLSSVVFLNSQKIMAADIKNEISLFVPLAFVEKSVGNKFDKDQHIFKKTIVRDNIVINAEDIPLLVPQIKIELSGPIKMNQYEINSPLNIVAHIEAFQIHQQVVKNIAGIPVNIHVDLDCQPFTISNDNLALDSNWLFNSTNGHLNTEIKELTIESKSPWNLSNIQCSGTSGAADLITQKIKDKLSSIDLYKNLIADELQKTLNSFLNDSLTELRKPQNIQAVSENELQLVNEISLSDTGFLFIYSNQKNFAQTPNVTTKIKDEDLLFLQAKNYQNPVIIMEKTDLTNLIKAQLTGKTIQKDLKSFAGFASLMKSRFKQFFAWPDLMNYSKNASFPTFSKLSKLNQLNIDSWQGRSGSGHILADIDTKVLSERSGKTSVYLRSNSSYQGQFLYQIQKGKIQIQSKLVSFKNNLTMDLQYIKSFNAKSKLPVQIINSSMQDTLNQLMTSYELPKLKGPDTNYLTSTIDENSGNLFIQLENEK